MLVRGAAILALTGCGFQPVPVGVTPQDGDVSDADAGDDSDVDAPPSDAALGMFMDAVEVGFSDGDDDPTLAPDMLAMFFNRTNDIWVTTRTDVSNGWNGPVVVASLSTGAIETTPKLSPDGLSMYWGSQRAGTEGLNDIWTAQRGSLVTTTFTAATRIDELSSTQDDLSATISGDGLAIVFVRRDPDDSLYGSTRTSASAPWSTPQVLAPLETPDAENGPFLTADGLTVYYAAARNGNTDLFVAHRPAITAAFGPPQPIGELNTAAAESDPWVSPDGRHIYFARGTRIWRASR